MNPKVVFDSSKLYHSLSINLQVVVFESSTRFRLLADLLAGLLVRANERASREGRRDAIY